MNRRTHLKKMAGLAGAALLGSSNKSFSTEKSSTARLTTGKIVTVTGEISPEELGLTLPHEHVFSIFGKDPARYPNYPEEDLMGSVIPYLGKLKKLGVYTIVDATAAYFGRHPEFLKKISEETGIQIITNTGYYGAAKGRYIPKHVAEESSDEIAERWIAEIHKGIDETGIYPGFIKTALEHKPMNEVDKKLIEAAAKTHKETGLSIQTHLGDNVYAANEAIDILSDNGVSADAWIFIHAHKVPDAQKLLPMARMGAYISFDGINRDSAESILAKIKLFKAEGMLNRVLLSHDGNSFRRDGTRKDYHFLVSDFKSRFLAFGFPESDFKQITEKNPANVLVVKKRLT